MPPSTMREGVNTFVGDEAMFKIIKRLAEFGVIPVVVLKNADDAIPLGEVISNSGLRCAEVTFRTNAAAKAIKMMSLNYPEILIGAGTVLTTSQVDSAIDAGAKFIVSPGLNPRIVEYCIDKNIPVIPGVSTPSEIEQAMEFGLRVLKLFPAEALGGLNYIQAISAPYQDIKFIPTGGINIKNVEMYLADRKILCCGGSWMVKEALIENKEFDKIQNNLEEVVKLVKRCRG